MPQLTARPPLRHRCFYPGEFQLDFPLGGYPTRGVPLAPIGLSIGLMWENANDEQMRAYAAANPGFSEPPEIPEGFHDCETDGHSLYVEYGGLWYPVSEMSDPYGRIHLDGCGNELIVDQVHAEPFAIELNQDDHIDAGWIAMQQDTIARLLGPELAYEICAHAIQLLEAWHRGGADQLLLRFNNLDLFHECTLRLWEYAAQQCGKPFDLAAKIAEYRTFWSGRSVAGQLDWYQQNGPTQAGETPADYQTELSEFTSLVLTGRDSINRVGALLGY